MENPTVKYQLIRLPVGKNILLPAVRYKFRTITSGGK